MFKAIAILGVVAGGAGYGVYAHTDLLGDKGGAGTAKSCCLNKAQATPSCCAVPCPDCSAGCENCCDVCDLCCGPTESVTTVAKKAKPSCCANTETAVAVKTPAPCCAVPCDACGDTCDDCPLCAFDCTACCGPTVK